MDVGRGKMGVGGAFHLVESPCSLPMMCLTQPLGRGPMAEAWRTSPRSSDERLEGCGGSGGGGAGVGCPASTTVLMVEVECCELVSLSSPVLTPMACVSSSRRWLMLFRFSSDAADATEASLMLLA